MRVALFVPCYVDQMRPRAALAALELLEAADFEVDFLDDLVCCGQPFLTGGEPERARALARRFLRGFSDFDAIVSPSGSCVATLREHLPDWAPGGDGSAIAERTFEFCDFLAREAAPLTGLHVFAHRVALHASCHALRTLRLGTPSETREPTRPDPAADLLRRVPGLELVDLSRRDECCGFGGVFSVHEEAVSSRMGLDRLEDQRRGRAEVVTSSDVSCLLHLEGLARRRALPMRFVHVAEILAEAVFGADWGRADTDGEASHGSR